jgi:hypothetical protein
MMGFQLLEGLGLADNDERIKLAYGRFFPTYYKDKCEIQFYGRDWGL